jgi:predicted RNase H-like nuclease
MLYLGIDGCPGGWIIAGLHDTVATARWTPRFSLVGDLSVVFQVARRGDASIVIDVPIGLPAHGVRACDAAARRLLARAHASSVFNAPVRDALAVVGGRPYVTDRQREAAYQRACRVNERRSGLRLSRQSFHLLPRIAEVDRRISPALQSRVHEGHPELIFQMLAGRPLATRKKTADGVGERVQVLAGAGVVVEVETVRARLGRQAVSADDVVDAAACAVAARRVTLGEALVLPRRLHDRVRDGRRLRMEIVA